MRLRIRLVDVLLDALLELAQHHLEVALLVAQPLFLADHPGGLLCLVAKYQVSQIHETGASARLGSRGLGRNRCGRRFLSRVCGGRWGGQKWIDGGDPLLGLFVFWVQFQNAHVHRPGFLHRPRPEETVGQTDVGRNEPGFVAGPVGELDALLEMWNAVWLEKQNLVGDARGAGPVLDVLKGLERRIQLIESPIPLPLLEQHLRPLPSHRTVVGTLGDKSLENFDSSLGRPRQSRDVSRIGVGKRLELLYDLIVGLGKAIQDVPSRAPQILVDIILPLSPTRFVQRFTRLAKSPQIQVGNVEFREWIRHHG